MTFDFVNTGRAGAYFDVRASVGHGPWFYTVEAGKRLSDSLAFDDAYRFAVRAPDGFLHKMRGHAGGANLQVSIAPDAAQGRVHVRVNNGGAEPVAVSVTSAYNDASEAWKAASRTSGFDIDTAASGGWYDVSVRCPDDRAFLRRFAGRIASGKPGVSDISAARFDADAAFRFPGGMSDIEDDHRWPQRKRAAGARSVPRRSVGAGVNRTANANSSRGRPGRGDDDGRQSRPAADA